MSRFLMNQSSTKSPLADNLVNEGSACHEFDIRAFAGSLLHLVVSTRPDLAFCTKEISRFLEEPKTSVVQECKRILG